MAQVVILIKIQHQPLSNQLSRIRSEDPNLHITTDAVKIHQHGDLKTPGVWPSNVSRFEVAALNISNAGDDFNALHTEKIHRCWACHLRVG